MKRKYLKIIVCPFVRKKNSNHKKGTQRGPRKEEDPGKKGTQEEREHRKKGDPRKNNILLM